MATSRSARHADDRLSTRGINLAAAILSVAAGNQAVAQHVQPFSLARIAPPDSIFFPAIQRGDWQQGYDQRYGGAIAIGRAGGFDIELGHDRILFISDVSI